MRGGVLTVTGGKTVAIATREAVPGDDLATLDREVLARFQSEAEAERVEHVETVQLQLNAIRRMVSRLQPGADAGNSGDARPRGRPADRRRPACAATAATRWLREGDMSVGRRLAQIGVLGWIFVVPTLAGLFFGRWLDAPAWRPASSGPPPAWCWGSALAAGPPGNG